MSVRVEIVLTDTVQVTDDLAEVLLRMQRQAEQKARDLGGRIASDPECSVLPQNLEDGGRPRIQMTWAMERIT